VDSTRSQSETSPQTWKFTTFGEFAVSPTPPKLRTRKTESLVTLLALRPGTSFSRDAIAAMFWPEDRQDTARQSVRMAISNIRTAFGKDVLNTDRDTISFNPNYVTSDFQESEKLFAQANLHPKNEIKLRTTLLDLTTKSLLPGTEAEWLENERQNLQEQSIQNTLALIKLLQEKDQYAEAIRIARISLAQCPGREDLHLALIQLYADSELTSLAISQFEILEAQLDELWGEPPSPAAYKILESLPKTNPTVRDKTGEGFIHGVIGRRNEIEALLPKLAQSAGKIITLLGTGGTGKTSLARAIHRIYEEQSKQTVFIDLTAETSAKSAAEKTVRSLKLRTLDASESTLVISRFFKDKNLLVIFDNIEQMKEEAESFFKAIIEPDSKCVFIATSRTPIGIPQEELFPVGPLDNPAKNAPLSEIKKASAIQLFESVAKSVQPDFEITTQTQKPVTDLCKRLDGLPLAIKLAAARCRIRTPAKILSSIKKSLSIISTTDDLIIDRHQKLTTTVQWSVDLLEPQVSDAAQRLALFTGRFSEEFADELLGQPSIDILEELVTASLLNVNINGEESEFWFFETVRTSLQELSQQQNTFHNQMVDFSKTMIRTQTRINQNDSLTAAEKLRTNIGILENYFTCLEYYNEQKELDIDIVRFALSTDKIAMTLESSRIRPLLKSYWDWPTQELPDYLRALCGSEYVRTNANIGDPLKERETLNRCLELAKENEEATFKVRYHLGSSYKVTGEYDKAINAMEWVIKNADRQDSQMMGKYLYHQGLNYGCLNDREKCFKYFKEALPYARKANDVGNIIRILFDLGSEYANLKDGDKAIECFIEAETLAESVGSLKLEGLTRWQHGDALLDLQKPKESLQMLKRSIKLVYEANFAAAEKWIFIKAAQAAVECGYFTIAAKLIAKGVHIRNEENRALAVYEQNYVQNITEQLELHFSAEEFHKLKFAGIHSEWRNLWDEFELLQP
jgi:DNA-binding SARP family transcriptional activator/energy-coupling factor transporter ATP-binding protein EcfA2